MAEWVRRELDAAKIPNRVAVKTVSVPSGDQSASSSIISGRLVMFYRDGRAQPTVTVPQFGKRLMVGKSVSWISFRLPFSSAA
jgi:hypothetical protein